MRNRIVWQRACGLKRTVMEGIGFDQDSEAVIVSVRPSSKARAAVDIAGSALPAMTMARAGGGGGPSISGRRGCSWRRCSRVSCRAHGPTVAAVPWARHRARHTRDFDDQAAWLAVRTSKSAVMELMRVAWRTVGVIVARVNADVDATVDRLDGLRRIGIDEISYKKGHRFLTIVVDHDSGRLVWAAPGRDYQTLHGFFDDLGEERAAQLTHISADMADWIARVVALRAPGAVRCADPFHIVAWAGEALDIERRRAWNLRTRGPRRHHCPPWPGNRNRTNNCRGPLRYGGRTPRSLSSDSSTGLSGSPRPILGSARLLLKEGLRYVFAVKGDEGKAALDQWLSWAQRSRLPAFLQLRRRITSNREAIDATLKHGLSNALVESTNTKIRLLTRLAFGFHGPEPLIALAMLALGGYPPRLPGRR